MIFMVLWSSQSEVLLTLICQHCQAVLSCSCFSCYFQCVTTIVVVFLLLCYRLSLVQMHILFFFLVDGILCVHSIYTCISLLQQQLFQHKAFYQLPSVCFTISIKSRKFEIISLNSTTGTNIYHIKASEDSVNHY